RGGGAGRAGRPGGGRGAAEVGHELLLEQVHEPALAPLERAVPEEAVEYQFVVPVPARQCIPREQPAVQPAGPHRPVEETGSVPGPVVDQLLPSAGDEPTLEPVEGPEGFA